MIGITEHKHIYKDLLTYWFFSKRFLFTFIGKSDIQEEESQRGRSFIRWFTPQATAMAGAEPIQSKEPGASSGSPTQVETQGLGLSLTAFPGHKQGAKWEVGPQGYESVPMWDPALVRQRL